VDSTNIEDVAVAISNKQQKQIPVVVVPE